MVTLDTLYPYHLTPGGGHIARRMLKEAKYADGISNGKLLLIGSRYGENVFSLAQRWGGEIIGVDEDSEGVFFSKMAATQLKLGKRVRFLFMSPLTLDFVDASFDAVILEGILSAHPKHKSLSEAVRVLKPGGLFGLADSYWKKMPVPTFIRDVWERLDFKLHTQQDMQPLLEAVGLKQATFEDCSKELPGFYRQFSQEVKQIAQGGFEGMKHMKGLVKHYKHEIDIYLKNGGDKYMGYCAITSIKPMIAPQEIDVVKDSLS